MPAPLFDPVVHEPTRMRLCALLIPSDTRDFSWLRDELQIADSTLSKHVSVLRRVGYVETTRRRTHGRDRMQVALTDIGRAAFCGHVAEIQRLARVVRRAEGHRSRRTANSSALPSVPVPQPGTPSASVAARRG
ncbi:hypothetical protein KEM60_01559 [Austwickia sp. TVS 96-490-7B]|uniref:transcriptional regulator n=1 Tax=Austwickia sp. TVS 96-490-7B TaxID=2830843 RepID=UPI001C560B08|nr:transcriptional regulator [Austwickia sp. TVS 96-490-7B]MBW3085362.1 hypothetical protein [Austwickia sp. TVS 96-490-7B]